MHTKIVICEDANSQLVDDSDSTYSYDPNGNRTMAGYDVGANNRLASDGTWSYSYDAEGNLTKKSLGVSAETWTCGFDHRTQIVWIEKRATDGGTLQKRIDYGYDVYGNQVDREVTVSGASHTKQAFEITNNSPGITHSVHDVWADLDSGGSLTNRFLLGDGQGEKIVRSGSGGTYWLLADGRLGSLREVTDSSGSIVNAITYDGFGNITSESGPSYTGNFTYTSLRRDVDANLLWAHWRGYNTGIAQWMSEDPIGFDAGDANVRRYVGNVATVGRDLSGLIFPDLWNLKGVSITEPYYTEGLSLSGANRVVNDKFTSGDSQVKVMVYTGGVSDLWRLGYTNRNAKNETKWVEPVKGSLAGSTGVKSNSIHFAAVFDSDKEGRFRWLQFVKRESTYYKFVQKPSYRTRLRAESDSPSYSTIEGTMDYGKWYVDTTNVKNNGPFFGGRRIPQISFGLTDNPNYPFGTMMSDKPSFDRVDGLKDHTFEARTYLVDGNRIIYSIGWKMEWSRMQPNAAFKGGDIQIIPGLTGQGLKGTFPVDINAAEWLSFSDAKVANPLK